MSTPAGVLVATWSGSGSISSGEEIDVELDASEPLAWDDVRIDAAPRQSFEVAGDAVQVTGMVLEVEHSGVMVVDVGGALLSFRHGGDRAHADHRPVRVRARARPRGVPDRHLMPLVP